MTSRKRSLVMRCVLCALAASLLLIVANPAFAKKKKAEPILKLRATAMDMNTARATYVDITVNEWSSEDERKELLAALEEGGSGALYKKLHKMAKKGLIRTGQTIGYDMRYAMAYENEGKRQMVMATDRPIGMGEVMRNSRSEDYNITIVHVSLEEGAKEGTGHLLMGAELGIDDKTGQLAIEGASTQPTKFTKVVVR